MLIQKAAQGTQAGDPVEAEAIDTAFFPRQRVAKSDSGRLFVGSIKTVIGHTEGTAGLAGIIKASLALQNSIIPPNMLFNRLNPKIEPFYKDLCIPTLPLAWPSVPHGCPRRASVNR
jgi:hybrid polyketide synthase/nonribosomal peptide synthetase ACE1